MSEDTVYQPLLEDFEPATPEAWRAAAEALLKGAPFDKVMRTPLGGELTLEPIYWPDALDELPQARTLPGFDGYLRGTRPDGYRSEPWEIAQELPYGDPVEYNRALLGDLMRGQTGINVTFDLATIAGTDPDLAKVGEVGACGLSIADVKDVGRAFKDVQADAISIHLRTGATGLPLGALYFAWLEEAGFDPKACQGSFSMDPLAVWAASGKLPLPAEALYDEMAALAGYCAAKAPKMRALGVTTLPYHQAGASAMEELGIGLATGAAYLRALLKRGFSINDAAKQIRFSFAIGPNFFLEIAKFRAARMLWAQIVEAFGGDAEAQKIQVHARTGLRNKSRHDPYVNMLRTTTEALSAVVGGIDSMQVGTFDEVVGEPDVFSRRIARNTQIILQEECELTGVVDPAGGSWAIETVTDGVASEAWKVFQKIESEGGMVAALQSGSVAKLIEATRKAEDKQLGQRRVRLVGVNVYPDANEKEPKGRVPDYAGILKTRSKEIAERRVAASDATDKAILKHLEKASMEDGVKAMDELVAAARLGASLGELTRSLRAGKPAGASIERLPAARLAAGYEAMRAACYKYAKKRGYGPRIFLTTLGPLRRHKLRADFTRGFFEPAGFDVIPGTGYDNPEAAVKALRESGASITVVCGTDDDYAEQFESFCQTIKESLPEVTVVLAGFPGDNEAKFRAAGMDDFIFIKSDNYATNYRYLQALGVIG
jgi:methylmalonyl-CoA mutase